MNIERRHHDCLGVASVVIHDAKVETQKSHKASMQKEYGDETPFTEKQILALISRTKNKYPQLKSIIVHIWGKE